MTSLAQRRINWRIVGWGSAVAVLAAPFVAMRFTREVQWTASDFLVAGLLIGAVGTLAELAARASPSRTYRWALALSLLGGFLITWANLAVGIVGSESDPANFYFFVALAVGIGAAIAGRFTPAGMSKAMLATAAALPVAFFLAVSNAVDGPDSSHVAEGIATAAFASLFLLSASLFRRAARGAQSSSSS